VNSGVRSIYTIVCVYWFFIHISELKRLNFYRENMPRFVLEIENLYILLRINADPTPYGRVITVTGYIRLLYIGAIVGEVPITAYGEPLNEDHQNLPSDRMESDY